MDARITLIFDEDVIHKAKKYADSHNMSLSRLTEIMYLRLTSKPYKSLDDFPISEWVRAVAEGKTDYIARPVTRKKVKAEYFNSRK